MPKGGKVVHDLLYLPLDESLYLSKLDNNKKNGGILPYENQ